MENLNQLSTLLALDIRNTMGLLFWGNFALAILVFTFQFALFTKESKKHLLIFGFSKIIQSFAWLAFFLRIDTEVYDPINFIIPNTLIFASFYLESVVMLLMVKGNTKKDFNIQFILFIFSLIIFYTAVAVAAPSNIRVSLASINIFILLIIPTLQFLTETSNSLFKKILGYNYIILLTTLAFRIIYPLFKTSTSLYSTDATQKAIFLIIFLMMTISGVGYLLLLQEEKEKQVKNLLDDKNQFFSIIAHDLRGPFNGIIGLSELLLEKGNKLDNEETNEFIELIHQSSKNTFSLLDNLLTWAQSQTGNLAFHPKKIEISALSNKTMHLLANIAKSKNISIQSNIEENQYVTADSNMLETIFRNLISNAIKFTPNNGEVVLSMTKKNDQMVFSVADNGIGIAAEKVKTLFAINHRQTTSGTNNETGTGLGLMLCKDFVEKHGGKIWVKSQPEKGSTFMFSIPDNN
jgi:signal transduction histidine kinase